MIDKILKFLGISLIVIDESTDEEYENLSVKDFGFDKKYNTTDKIKSLLYFMIFTPDENDPDYNTEMVYFEKLSLKYLYLRIKRQYKRLLVNNTLLFLSIMVATISTFTGFFLSTIISGGLVLFLIGTAYIIRRKIKEIRSTFNFTRNFNLVFEEK